MQERRRSSHQTSLDGTASYGSSGDDNLLLGSAVEKGTGLFLPDGSSSRIGKSVACELKKSPERVNSFKTESRSTTSARRAPEQGGVSDVAVKGREATTANEYTCRQRLAPHHSLASFATVSGSATFPQNDDSPSSTTMGGTEARIYTRMSRDGNVAPSDSSSELASTESLTSHEMGLAKRRGARNSNSSTPVDLDANALVDVKNEDVLFGRGKVFFFHPGNVYFRRLCADQLERYRSASSRLVKVSVIQEIINSIQGTGGRFLKRNSSGEWLETTSETAKEKTGHTLRDALGNRNKGILRMHNELVLRQQQPGQQDPLAMSPIYGLSFPSANAPASTNVASDSPGHGRASTNWSRCTTAPILHDPSPELFASSMLFSRVANQQHRSSSPVQFSGSISEQHRSLSAETAWHQQINLMRTGPGSGAWWQSTTVNSDELHDDVRSIVAEDSLDGESCGEQPSKSDIWRHPDDCPESE